MNDKVFFDTNILVYAILGDGEKQSTAMALLRQGGNISIQVINEFCNVAKKKTTLGWADIANMAGLIGGLVNIHSLGVRESEGALLLAKEYQFSFYDSLILTSALQNGGQILFTEDLQHNRKIAGLTIINPFK